MATVKDIIPCVCTKEPPNKIDWYEHSVYYGMPQLKVSNGIEEHIQFWVAFCPLCGRGGCVEYKSQYFALKHWNEMQTELWRSEKGIDVE